MSDETRSESFPVLETQRLLLRELQPSDAEAAFQFYSDPDVMRYYDVPMTRLEDVREAIAEHRRRYENDAAMRWAITLKGEDTVIGTCGYWRDSTPDDSCWYATMSYVLAQPYWNQGIVTEALRAIIRYGFDHYRLHRIEAHAVIANPASLRVLRKLGFQEEGHLRERFFEHGRFHDEKLFGLLSRDGVDA